MVATKRFECSVWRGSRLPPCPRSTAYVDKARVAAPAQGRAELKCRGCAVVAARVSGTTYSAIARLASMTKTVGEPPSRPPSSAGRYGPPRIKAALQKAREGTPTCTEPSSQRKGRLAKGSASKTVAGVPSTSNVGASTNTVKCL